MRRVGILCHNLRMKIFSWVGVLLLLSISSAYADTELTIEFVNKGNKAIRIYPSELTCIETNRYDNFIPPNSTLLTFWRVSESDKRCALGRSTASVNRDDGISFLRLEFAKKRMDLVGLLPYGFIEVRKHELQGIVTFLKNMGNGSAMQSSSLPTTLRDKLVAVGTSPLIVQADGQVQEPESFNELLKELQYETAHLKVQMAPPSSHDVAANVREEAMALVEWMDANPTEAASLEQHTPGRLTPDLNAVLQPSNAVPNQQKTNQLPISPSGKPVVMPPDHP
jgi:hypothetical protein